MDGKIETGRVTKLFSFKGLQREEVAEAYAGDIVMISGFATIDIGETLCENAEQEALPAILVDEPTISLSFMVNNSPFAGREGKLVTNKQIRERLEKELEVNVGLKIDFFADSYKVYGRGELHIAILMENMRREGYEIQVSQPQVIVKEIDGKKQEPFEEATVDVPEIYSGMVIEKIGKRKGIMTNMKKSDHKLECFLRFQLADCLDIAVILLLIHEERVFFARDLSDTDLTLGKLRNAMLVR